MLSSSTSASKGDAATASGAAGAVAARSPRLADGSSKPKGRASSSSELTVEEELAYQKPRRITDLPACVLYIICICIFCTFKVRDVLNVNLRWMSLGLNDDGHFCGMGAYEQTPFVYWNKTGSCNTTYDCFARPKCTSQCYDYEFRGVEVGWRRIGHYCFPAGSTYEGRRLRKRLVNFIERHNYGAFYCSQQVLSRRLASLTVVVDAWAMVAVVGFVNTHLAVNFSKIWMTVTFVAPSIICFTLGILYAALAHGDSIGHNFLGALNATATQAQSVINNGSNQLVDIDAGNATNTVVGAMDGFTSSAIVPLFHAFKEYCAEWLPNAGSTMEATLWSIFFLCAGYSSVSVQKMGDYGLRATYATFECIRTLPSLVYLSLFFGLLNSLIHIVFWVNFLSMASVKDDMPDDGIHYDKPLIGFLWYVEERIREGGHLPHFLFTCFMCFWTLGLLSGLKHFATSYCVQLWYYNMNTHSFSKDVINKVNKPSVRRALWLAFRYHFGTVALYGLLFKELILLRNVALFFFFGLGDMMVDLGSEEDLQRKLTVSSEFTPDHTGSSSASPHGVARGAGKNDRSHEIVDAMFNCMRKPLAAFRWMALKYPAPYDIHTIVMSGTSWHQAQSLTMEIIKHDISALQYMKVVFRAVRPFSLVMVLATSMWLSWHIDRLLRRYETSESALFLPSRSGAVALMLLATGPIAFSLAGLIEQVCDTMLYCWCLDREYLQKREHPRLHVDDRLPGFLRQGPRPGKLTPQRVFEHTVHKNKVLTCNCFKKKKDDNDDEDSDEEEDGGSGGLFIRVYSAHLYESVDGLMEAIASSSIAAQVARIRSASGEHPFYCMCKVVSPDGIIRAEFKTRRINSPSPDWKAKEHVHHFCEGDHIEFTVWEHTPHIGESIIGTAVVTKAMLGVHHVVPKQKLRLYEMNGGVEGWIQVQIDPEGGNSMGRWARQSANQAGFFVMCCKYCCCCCCYSARCTWFVGILAGVTAFLWWLFADQVSTILTVLVAQTYVYGLMAFAAAFVLYMLVEAIMSVGRMCAKTVANMQRKLLSFTLMLEKQDDDSDGDEDGPDDFESEWMARRSPLPSPNNLLNHFDPDGETEGAIGCCRFDTDEESQGMSELLSRMQKQRTLVLKLQEEEEQSELKEVWYKDKLRCCGPRSG